MKNKISSFRPGRSIIFTLVSSTAIAISSPEMAPRGADEIKGFIVMDMAADSRIGTASITVQIDNGIAVLSGTVATIDQSERAVARALAAPEVRGVVNQIAIADSKASDTALKNSVKNALLKNPAIDAKRIVVAVEGKSVTLSGEVGTWDEQEIARETSSCVAGVQTIKNETQVVFDSIRTDAQIQEQVRQLISNDPLYDGLSLSVSVKEGVLKLKGEVGSRQEYDRLVRRTSVTGVFEVNADRLTLNSDLKMEALGDKDFTPEQMTAALGDALRTDTRVNTQAMNFGLADGVVTLTGFVDAPAAKVAAESTARGIPGVMAVSNQLSIGGGSRPLVAASVAPVQAPN